MPSLSQLSQLLPGCYSKTSSSSSSSSPWHHGELFQLRGHNRFRFLNKAGAFWSFEILTTDDEANSIHLDENDQSIMTFKAEIIESPDNNHQASSENQHEGNDDPSLTLPTLCIISFSGLSSSIPSFHFNDDGQEYRRFSDLPSFPIATEFLTASLGSSSVSLATTALRFVTENVLRAQRAYLTSDLNEFHKIMQIIREKYPIGSIEWKRDVKFVKKGPFFQSYCLVRILDFIDRKSSNNKNKEDKNEKIYQPFNLTIIGVKETETDAPDSFEEFVSGINGNEENVKKILLDSRLFPISQNEDDDDDSDSTCQDEEIFLSALSEKNNNCHHVEFDTSVPLPIRSMVFWYAELLYHLGEGNFSKTKVSYQIFDEESMKLFVASSDQEQNSFIFPQFPWQSLKPSSQKTTNNGYDFYNEADQFIIIYPRAEPHSWIEDSSFSLSPSSSPSPGSTASFASGFFSPNVHRKNNNQNLQDFAVTDDDNNIINASATFSSLQQQYRFTTSGITLSPSGRPTAVLDDRSLFEPDKCPGLEFNHNMRSAYYCHWLLHETSHAWYEMKRRFQENVSDIDHDEDNHFYDFYGHLNLEPESHSWFDRKLWPDDFVSESGMEEDYFFEAIEKRFLVGSNEESKVIHDWKLAVNRTNWPFWAKLKNRPKLVNPKELPSPAASILGKYRSDETIFDEDITEDNKQDYISIFGILRKNAGKINDYSMPKIIKWQSCVGESPMKLYLENDSSDNDILRYSSISPCTTSSSLNDDDFLLSKLSQDRSMHVSFHTCSTSNFSSSSSSWCWVAVLRIGSSFSCLPAMTFYQYERNPELVLPENESEVEKTEEAKQKSQNRNLLLSVEQKAKQEEQRRSKQKLFQHKVAILETKSPKKEKSTTVFNKYSENGKMDSSVCVCAIMNSLLPQANSILVLNVVKGEFVKSGNKEVNEEVFCIIVKKVFERWIENEKEQILDDLGLSLNEVDVKQSDAVEDTEEL